MLKIYVVHEGGHHYYVDDLVPGRAEGTLVAGEEPGVWNGAAAATLGLAGKVEAGSFAEVMAGRDPSSGRALRARAGERSVAAYDLSFCAPKSVSILHLLSPRELAAETGAGHQAAVAEAIGYLERSVLAVRRRRAGRDDLLPTAGAVAGGFVHRTSRALDPHLHTHLVVANVAEGVDGEWSALDSRRLHRHLAAVQGIYHARLRFELSRRLGASWEVGPAGLGDVVGVPFELRHLFSQRSADMARFVFLRHGGRDRGRHVERDGGRDGRARPDGAFHATRPAKEVGHTVEDLLLEWRHRAADFGHDLGDLTRVVGLGCRGPEHPAVDLDVASRRLELAAREQRPLARHELVAVLSASSFAGTSANLVESLAHSLTEAAGTPVEPGKTQTGWSRGERDRGRTPRVEPRWRAEDLRHAMHQGIEALVGERRGMDTIAWEPDLGHEHRIDRGKGLEAERRASGSRRPRSRDLEIDPPTTSLGRAR